MGPFSAARKLAKSKLVKKSVKIITAPERKLIAKIKKKITK